MQDIHTHLYWESYDDDRELVMKRAQEVGVTTMLVVGTNITENEKALALAETQDILLASVGMHPNEFRNSSAIKENWAELLGAQAKRPQVVAIGECGLDYSESHGLVTASEKEEQKEAFKKQIALAVELSLPLIVHCRSTHGETDDAYRDLLKILQPTGHNLPALVLHCYMGSQSVTKEFLQIPNIYFSFTGNITYPVKQTIKDGDFDFTESVKLIPTERLFAETDCPFLAPQDQRGQRNEPAFVDSVARKIAELKNIPKGGLVLQLEQNFTRVFRRE